MSQKLTLPTLTRLQSELYQILLERGEVSASELIEASGFKRATLYKTLYELESKGLASKRDLKKKLYFKPETPVRLLEGLNSEIDKLERGKNTLEYILPQLQASYSGSTQKPIVQVYQGIEGLKKIYLDMIEVGETIYAALETADVEEELFKWLTTTYISKRVKARVHANVIVSTGAWAQEYNRRDTQELRTSRIVPIEKFPFQHELDIYGDRVAFIHYRKNEELMGIVVRHKNIAMTMKALFDLAWIGAK